MAKPKNGRTEEPKSGSTGQKLGCHLSADASALLGALEYLIGGSAGNVVERALVALADTLPRTQADTLTTMLRSKQANLGRLRKSCGHSSAKNDAPDQNLEEVEESRGVVDGLTERTNTVNRMANKFTAAADLVIDSLAN